VQLRNVVERGTFLAQRWEDESGINVYYLPDAGRGFFVEVGIADESGQAIMLRSFNSNGPLDDYVHAAPLPS
jgi:hypothetical protein